VIPFLDGDFEGQAKAGIRIIQPQRTPRGAERNKWECSTGVFRHGFTRMDTDSTLSYPPFHGGHFPLSASSMKGVLPTRLSMLGNLHGRHDVPVKESRGVERPVRAKGRS